jgi:hypothetical protein
MKLKGTITLYACKSTRKNSKSIYKTIKIWNGDRSKSNFTDNDIWDFMDFMVRSEYRYFKVVAYGSDSCICTFNNYDYTRTIEVVINRLYDQMRLLNFKEWDFTKADLHNNPNTRYYINKYYNNIE